MVWFALHWLSSTLGQIGGAVKHCGLPISPAARFRADPVAIWPAAS
jgi:hypothetical protein